MRSTNLCTIGLLFGLVGVGLTPTGARAQTVPASSTSQTVPLSSASSPSGGLQEVVVTAERRTERLQDVPISLSAITQEQMDSQGMRSFDDVALLTPGINFERNGLSGASNYNDENSDLSIRGIDSSAGASTTAIYVDDTPIQTRHIGFGSVDAFPALFDLERVEVLRGPQGTLFGAGAEGGAIRFITPAPSLYDYSGYSRTELAKTEGGDTSDEAGFAEGGPIIEGKLGFRASVYYRRDGGYVDRMDYRTDQVTEPDANWQETASVHLELAWALADHMTLTPSFMYQRLYIADTAAFWPSLSNLGNGVFNNGNAQPDSSTDPWYLTSMKYDWDLGWSQLTANTSFFSRHQHAVSDYTQFDRAVFGLPPQPPYGALGGAPFHDTQQNVTAEARLQSNSPDSRLSWTAGLYFAHLNENETQEIIDPTINEEFTAAYGVPLCTPEAPCPGGQIATQPLYRIIDREAATYGELTYNLSRAWSVTAGARIERAQFTGATIQYGPFVGPTSNVDNPLTSHGTGTATPVTPRLVLSYHANRDNLFYASIAKGYRVGGVNQGLTSSCASSLAAIGLTQGPSTYRSDSLWSYELGAKNELLNSRLQIDTSVFLIDWRGIQQNVYLFQCGLQFVANLGDVHSTGGDIDIQYRPIDPFVVSFTAAKVDARYMTSACAGPAVCAGPDATALPVVSPGDRLPSAPWTFTLSSEYLLPRWGDRKPYVRFDYHYATAQTTLLSTQDPRNGVIDPTIPGLPIVQSLNARAGLRWGGIDMSLYGENLTNEHPLLFLSRDTLASDLYFARSDRPRTVGLTATYNF